MESKASKPAAAKPAVRAGGKDTKTWMIAGAASAVILLIAAGAIVFLLSGPGKAEPQNYPVHTDLDTADDDSDPGTAPEVSTALAPPASELEARLALQLDTLPKVIQARSELLADPAMQRQMRAGAKGEASPPAQVGPPRHWEIHFPKGNTVENYAKQLDFFGIELGVLMPDNKIIYAYSLSKLKPDTRTGPVEAESRYYLSWSRGDLVNADRELFSAAGVEARDRLILKFLPPAIEQTVAALEKSYAGDKADRIEKTRFGIRRRGESYEIYVLEQTYQQQPS